MPGPGGKRRKLNENGASASTSWQSSADPDVIMVEKRCITDIRDIEFAFAWTIKNFSHRKDNDGPVLESMSFSFGSNAELTWRLRVCPDDGDGGGTSMDYLVVGLELMDFSEMDQIQVPTKFKISILNDRNEKTHTNSYAADDKFLSFNNKDDIYTIGKFIKFDVLLNEANSLLPDDSLTFFCEGFSRLDYEYMSRPSRQPKIHLSKSTLFKDLGSLFENREFSDFTLSVGEKDMPVHKAILAARSSVFAAMLKYELEENKQNRVAIEDIDYDVLREMLLYIYTGESQNLEKMARDLLVAADKYNLSGLKEMCEVTLCSTLATENAVDLAVLADTYSAKQLLTQVMQFISTHAKEVILTPGWKNVKCNQLPVIINIFEALAASVSK